ncbi:MAG: CPBP family intramembrane glutamic endopeptidase [Actinomycetota bacterium]
MAIVQTDHARARRWPIPAAVMLGCAALAARSPSLVALLPTVAAGVLGIAGVVARLDVEHASRARIAVVTLVGVGAVVAVRAIAPPIHGVYTGIAFAGNIVAAVAEEAFFRRFIYGWLAARREALAITGAAALFALIHIPMYGVAVVPIDFAAGMLLGWQRRETGTWLSPAVTHVVANLLQMR